MVGFILLGLSMIAIYVVFKGSEYADDSGLMAWWIPPILLTLLAVIFACHAASLKAASFKGRVKRPEFQTGPLPHISRVAARIAILHAIAGPRIGRRPRQAVAGAGGRPTLSHPRERRDIKPVRAGRARA